MSSPILSAQITMPEGTAKRLHAKAMRVALKEPLQQHLYKTLGDHFKENSKTAPGGAYGYKKRSEEYTLRKFRKFGHKRPWDRSGQAKRHIRANSAVTGTQHRATLQIRNIRPMTEQMRRELEAVTADEFAAMQQTARRVYNEYLAKNKPLKVTKRV